MIPVFNKVTLSVVEQYDPALAARLVSAGATHEQSEIPTFVLRKAGGDSFTRLQQVVDRYNDRREADTRSKRDTIFAIEALGTGAAAAIGVAAMGGPMGALLGAGAVVTALIGAKAINFLTGIDIPVVLSPVEPRQDETDELLDRMTRDGLHR